jgi:hypothetical protein
MPDRDRTRDRGDRTDDNGDVVVSDKVGTTTNSVANNNKLHTMTAYEQKLFGIYGAANFWDQEGDISWVNTVANGGKTTRMDAGLATGIVPSKYLHGSIRYPSGTPANYMRWDDDYVCGLDGDYKEIFQKDNIYNTSVGAYVAAFGQPLRYNMGDFCEYAREWLPNAQIHVCLNVYTQTYDEIVAGIERFKTLLNEPDRVLYWEMGNEIDGNSYLLYANDDANYDGAFANLSAGDLAIATTYFENQFITRDAWARKQAEVCRYIRANYPNDKIGLATDYIQRWNNPAGGPKYVSAAVEYANAWADAMQRHITDDLYDAVIPHPYVNASNSFTTLNGQSIPASGKEVDASLTDNDDKWWRWHNLMSQEFLRLCMNDMTELWPNNKDLWLTEWGLLSRGDDTDYSNCGILNPTTTGTGTSIVLETQDGNPYDLINDVSAPIVTGAGGDWAVARAQVWKARILSISTTTNPNDTINLDRSVSYGPGNLVSIFDQYQPDELTATYPHHQVWISTYYANFFISIIEEHLRWKGVRKLDTTVQHNLGSGDSSTLSNYISGYLTAPGVVANMIKRPIEACTKFCLPIIDDAGLTYDGQAWGESVQLHPVRAALFENDDASEQWMFIVNNSPNDRTVTQPFALASGKKLEITEATHTPYEEIVPDSTYESYDDLSDFVAATSTITVQAFSIYVFSKVTSQDVDFNNFTLTVT